MKLSIRSRVLLAYAVLAVLVFVNLFSSLSRLKEIGAQLNIIQGAYLPMAKSLNSFVTFFHLQGDFNFDDLVEHEDNEMLLDTILKINPRFMKSTLERDLKTARKTLSQTPLKEGSKSLDRIKLLSGRLIKSHENYIAGIRRVLSEINIQSSAEYDEKNAFLIGLRKDVLENMNALSRRLDEDIQNSTHSTVLLERRAVFMSIGLSVGTLIIAILIGLVAILSLRPLAYLKKAAKEIAAGDLSQRVSVNTSDEVGDLAQEFNRMADSIEQRDEKLRDQQDQLLQSERMAVVGRMASKISHEVRNPLNALSLNLELLEDEIESPESKATLKAMSKELYRLDQIAESYLSLGRSPRKSDSKTDVPKLLNHLETLVRPEAEKKKINVLFDITDDLPELKVDPVRLEQALLNLVRNSMDVLPEGGSCIIKTEKKEKEVEIRVGDDGPGIPKEILPHVFKPFYTTKEKGTGLGLAITQEVIRQDGGSIDIESSSREGTLFRIRFPYMA